MANIKSFISDSGERYKTTLQHYMLKLKQKPELSLPEFLRSARVNKKGFMEWMKTNGYSYKKSKNGVSIIRKKEVQTNTVMEKEVENRKLISDKDDMVLNDSRTVNSDAKQYWWLNIAAKALNIDKVENGETKTLPFDTINKSLMKKDDVQFYEWIERYLVDTEENPHFRYPISYRDFAISLLDYNSIPVNKKNVNSAYTRIRKNLDKYLKTKGYVCNPPIVLSADSYSKKEKPQRAAWRYPINKSNGNIETDEHGNRKPRKLEYGDCLYFYRETEIPKNPYIDKRTPHALIGDKKYVQSAPEDVDPEINYPNIRNIRLISPISIKEGDIVIACAGKKIVAFLDVVSVGEREVELKIRNKLPLPFPIYSLKESDSGYTPEKGVGLFSITNSDFDCISRIVDEFMKYSKEDLLNEAYIDEITIDSIINAINYKKNIILQGVPGVGKTFLAKRLAYAMIGHKNEKRVCIVQFHPNYTYEDFIIGYKPCDDGKFQLRPGVFMEFCKKAAEDKEDKKYFFIIDEINRGNLSKIFGEAFTLIDKDHRGESIKLANPDDVYKEFEIPENVYIIGLMNTADRSLAMLDIALQRRFEFLPLMPAFETKSFKKYMDSLKSDIFKEVINRIIKLNKEIEKEPALGEGFYIGHSYFCISKERKIEYEKCLKDIKAWLKNVIHYEIIPILRAYCFDEKETFDRLSTPLLEVFK